MQRHPGFVRFKLEEELLPFGAWGTLEFRVLGLGFRGLGFRGLGFRGLGFRGLGFRGLGCRGLGFRVHCVEG